MQLTLHEHCRLICEEKFYCEVIFASVVLQFQAVVVVKAVWIPPRKPLHENEDYTQLESIAKVGYWSQTLSVGSSE